MQHLPVTVSSPPPHRAADAQANSPFAKHFWDQVCQAPYKATLASAFVLGCALLQWYLMWIDHVPSDLLALLGLATLVSAWLAALWAFATFMMFATVFAVMLYDVEPPRPLIAFVGQAAGACGVLGFLLVKLSVGGGMLVAAGVGAIVCLVLLRREATARTAFASAVALFSMLVGGAAVALGVLTLAFTGGMKLETSWWSIGWWLSGCLLVLMILLVLNARAAAFARYPLAVALVSLPVSAAVVLSVAGWRAVPTTLAERVGIRLPGTSTLIVSASTCRLIAVAVELGQGKPDQPLVPTCEVPTPVVRAEVQLRWAGRWLLLVRELNGVSLTGITRVTIPDAETQLVLKGR